MSLKLRFVLNMRQLYSNTFVESRSVEGISQFRRQLVTYLCNLAYPPSILDEFIQVLITCMWLNSFAVGQLCQIYVFLSVISKELGAIKLTLLLVLLLLLLLLLIFIFGFVLVLVLVLMLVLVLVLV